MHFSLRTQLMAVFGLLVLLLVGGLTARISADHAERSLAERGEALQTLARNVAAVLADGLEESLRDVQRLADDRSDEGLGPQAPSWPRALERLHDSQPHYTWVGVTDASGRVVAASQGLLVGQDVSSRPWFQPALQGGHIGDVHPAKLLERLLGPRPDGEPLRFLDFAAPLRDRTGRTVGVLAVHADWQWAQDVIHTLRSQRSKDRGMRVFILDRGGEVIHRPRDAAAEKPLALDRLPVDGGVEWAWSDGRRYLTAAVPLPGRTVAADMGWVVVARLPMDQAHSAAARGRAVILLTAGVAALLAMGLAAWLAHRLAGPLAAMSRAARRVQAGELELELPHAGSSRELRQLSEAIGDMKTALLQRERALESANAELERRVEQRTAELGEALGRLEQANEVLRGLAHRDGLTGVYNRRAIDERLAQEVARARRTGQPLSVLMIDVDHFKRVNDTLGHAGGDRVLQGVAARLAAACRASDVVGRYGGEEFVLLLPDTTGEGACRVAEKLREAVRSAHDLPCPVTMSAGVASTADGHLPESGLLLRAADDALYAAKAAGRDRVVRAQPEATDAALLV